MVKQKTKNTEETILDAAKKIFLRKGMTGARMQEIADEAGINKAMLHYYYRSKDKLFEAVFMQAIQLIIPKLVKIIQKDISLFDKIRLFAKDYMGFIAQHPYIPGFIINELQRNPGIMEKISELQPKREMKTLLQAQINEAVREGKIRPITVECLLTDMISLSVFPIMAKPLLKSLLGKDDPAYNDMLEKRSDHVAELIINSIKTTS